MPVRYERDDARRRVVVTISGAFQLDDILVIMERLRSEDTWAYGVLYDLRHVVGYPTMEDLQHIVAQAATREGEGPRGPVALLANKPILYSKLCTYTALTRSTTRAVEVFRDLDEADKWL
ncbi:MAG TPA: hypothetical protein VGY48_31675, partial [Vicinamibacterales bacterium]|nr:hypothetical protein [Vicinamibacterales bacterium]